jgi:hypothetical protein
MVLAFRLYLLRYGVNGQRRVALVAGDTADMEMGWKVTDMLPRGSEEFCSTALCRYHLLKWPVTFIASVFVAAVMSPYQLKGYL